MFDPDMNCGHGIINDVTNYVIVTGDQVKLGIVHFKQQMLIENKTKSLIDAINIITL